MATQSLVHDASASTIGIVYQLYVALQKCFEMTSGQKVMIERFGDVSISESQQIEVKHYAIPLTDNHENFWKTLKNWMQDEFDDSPFSSLLLFTTQEFGKNATIAAWNDENVESRLQILKEIRTKAEDKEARRLKSNGGNGSRIPKSLIGQRYVLDACREEKLRRVVGKFGIASSSPDHSTLYERICDLYCKPILQGKRKEFLNVLLGFVISPESISTDKWDITFDQFDGKVLELTPQYCQRTVVFPTSSAVSTENLSHHDAESYSDALFVKKIQDIEHHTVINEAKAQHLGMKRTVLEEFKDYEVSATSHSAFQDEVLGRFEPQYRIASRKSSDTLNDSKTFFDERISEAPPGFNGFDTTPIWFRNGVLHEHLNDPTKDLKWRLERE